MMNNPKTLYEESEGKEEYTMKNLKFWWTASLLVITCIVLIWTICSFAGIKLPDTVIRIMGVLDLCAIPVLIYSSVKLNIQKKEK